MLAAKFDGLPERIPATWMWSRLVRMKSTRDGANQREKAGHLIGGYATLLAAMAARIEQAGGTVRLSAPIERIAIEAGRATGVVVGGTLHRYDSVVLTMQGPVAARLMPDADAAYRARLTDVPYLGIVCPLMVLDRPLTGTWTVNIADTSIPFTGVIETTSYLDSSFVGGHHLVYIPKYHSAREPLAGRERRRDPIGLVRGARAHRARLQSRAGSAISSCTVSATSSRCIASARRRGRT